MHAVRVHRLKRLEAHLCAGDNKTVADLIEDRFGLPTQDGAGMPAEGEIAHKRLNRLAQHLVARTTADDSEYSDDYLKLNDPVVEGYQFGSGIERAVPDWKDSFEGGVQCTLSGTQSNYTARVRFALGGSREGDH